ncbi:hypothetical protein JCM8115_004660 [Rhodotorula mucilaginosa]
MREKAEHFLPLLALGYIVMISLLSGLLGVRLAAAHDSFRRMSILHFLALLLLTMSLLFVVTSAILILGKGAHLRRSACEGAIWLCISLYALSKLVLYLLLLEKVWAVHGLASLGHRNRWDSKWYRVGAVLVLGWVAVAILEIPGRVAVIRNGTCHIGLRLFTTIPLLAVETVANLYLTLAFLLPIWRSKSPQILRLARRSSIAALISLATSFSNGFIITILGGKELSWICLGSCSIDISVNALVVYAVTISPAATSPSGPLCPSERARWRVRPPKKRTTRPDLSAISVQVTQEVQVDDEREPSRPLWSCPALLPSPPPTVGGQGAGKWRTSHPFNLNL